MPKLQSASDSGDEAPSPPAGGTAQPYIVIFDGGSLGNPGKGYGSFLLVSPASRKTHRKLDFSADHSELTNNQAEYMTLIEALQVLRNQLGERAPTAHVRIEGDSKLVLNQLKGTWKVKNAGLQKLHAQARELVSSFGSVDFQWHRRERSVRILGH